MNNGLAANFRDRESSQFLDNNPSNGSLLADASGVASRDLSIHSGSSMAERFLPPTSIYRADAIQTVTPALITYPSYYQNQRPVFLSHQPYYPVRMPVFNPSVDSFKRSDFSLSRLLKKTHPAQPQKHKDRLLDKEKSDQEKPRSKSEEIEEKLYKQVNRIREAKGLLALVRSQKMQQMAEANSQKMNAWNRVGHFAHRGWEVAALLPWGRHQSAQSIAKQIMTMWMNSSEHRKILLSNRIAKLGVAVDGKGQTIHFA